jgi:hypothetical protein
MNPVKIQFSEEAKQVLATITELAANNKKERMILKALLNKIDLIRQSKIWR